MQYGKVERNFGKFEKETGVKIINPDIDFRIKLATELAEIAYQKEIKVYACCSDYLIGPRIEKGHCIDGNIIKELFYNKNEFKYSEKPTRKECGCASSTDIGAYDTCPHGCIYCYANINKNRANSRFKNHDETATFLGYTKVESNRWMEDLKIKENEKSDSKQMELS